MNDFQHPCKQWAEAISMAAAGCLSSDEGPEIRRHMETCSACREHFRQLAKVCGALAEFRTPTNGEDTVILQRVMSAIVLGKPQRHVVPWSWFWAAAAVVAASLILAITLRWTVFAPPCEPAGARNTMPSPSAEPKAGTPSTSVISSPPTPLAYECAFAQSDETLERLLAQEARRLDLRSVDTTPVCPFKMEITQ